MRVLSQFVAAATNVSHFPAPSLPEVAFLGRSNVGKSSVLNSLVGTKIARTSSTPGRTQSINFFEIRWAGKPKPELLFADLPGYGYARVPREILQQWSGFIEPYLQERPCLALCLALIDISVPPQESDRQLLHFLAAAGRPTCIVATKSDRISKNKLSGAVKEIENQYSGIRVLPFSARTGMGKQELWKEIHDAARNFSSTPSESL